jgi:hypothetical protein
LKNNITISPALTNIRNNFAKTSNPMDALQQQISALNYKVDALHQILESLSHKVLESLQSDKANSEAGDNSLANSLANARRNTYQDRSNFDLSIEHKDVLVDLNGLEVNTQKSSHKEFSSEIQIQRLTAQLTAAYNRIAALEEQLLAKRIH